MYIKETELVNFRNYEKAELKFHRKVNIFTGNNAQGKTNLLEAVYISAFGRSFRFGNDNEMIKLGENLCRVKTLAERDDRETSVEIAIGKKEKGVKINGVKIKKTAELLENILIVVFSPEDLKIIKGEPDKRRSFMDRELSQIRPSYYSDLASYRKALMQRNALLKEKRAKKQDFDVWDLGLSEYGTRVIQKRKDFIEKIKRISEKTHKSITDGKENLDIIYDASVYAGENTKEAFLFKLKENLSTDILRGNTEAGPHRDDLKISINGLDIRKFGSQGQQRTAALSLKLAELALIKEETGEEAILLLDDVLSELDSDRQKYLIKTLRDVQLFITATEINSEVYKSLPAGYLFNISNGKIENIGELVT